MPYPLPMFSFARNGDVQRLETGFPTITGLPHLGEMARGPKRESACQGRISPSFK